MSENLIKPGVSRHSDTIINEKEIIMRQFDNKVQEDYYNKFNKIWAGGVDDWFDMNNFMFALLAFVKDNFRTSHSSLNLP